MENIYQNLKDDLALKYLVREPKIVSEEKPVFIFLHGIGSNEKDLFSLAPILPDHFTVISARSPYIIGYESYSFYDIDYSSGTPVINPEQAEISRKLIIQFIEQIKEKYNIDADKVYLGGFSQGAIMSHGVALTNPKIIKAVAGFSGRILQEVRPLIKADDSLKNLKVFMAHGVDDYTVPVRLAREAKDYLATLGIQPEYHEFAGGHEIPENMLNKFKNWINKEN